MVRLSAEKKDGEADQEPMDLDLEQMFEVHIMGCSRAKSARMYTHH